MRIRNCLLALSLVSALPFQLMAADTRTGDEGLEPATAQRNAAGQRTSTRQQGQQNQQTPTTTEG